MTITTRVEGVQVAATRNSEGQWEATILPALEWFEKPFDLRSTYVSTDLAVVFWAAECDVTRWVDEGKPE